MATVNINPNLLQKVRKRALDLGERIGIYVETAVEMRLKQPLKAVEARNAVTSNHPHHEGEHWATDGCNLSDEHEAYHHNEQPINCQHPECCADARNDEMAGAL